MRLVAREVGGTTQAESLFREAKKLAPRSGALLTQARSLLCELFEQLAQRDAVPCREHSRDSKRSGGDLQRQVLLVRARFIGSLVPHNRDAVLHSPQCQSTIAADRTR